MVIMAARDPEVVHITDHHNRTALHYAIFNANPRKVDVVWWIIELGIDVNAVDEDRKSALHHAAENGKAKVIPILVQNGASVTIKDNNKRTPIESASNDHIRELIIIYSNPRHDPTQADMKGL